MIIMLMLIAMMKVWDFGHHIIYKTKNDHERDNGSGQKRTKQQFYPSQQIWTTYLHFLITINTFFGYLQNLQYFIAKIKIY